MRGRNSGVPTFFWIAALLLTLPLFATHTPNPTSVTVAGSLQSELGCSDDWQPACAATHLTFDADDDVWQGTFDVPAGSWEYKAPLNDSWTENYGANAAPGGANIGLSLASPASVKFYYDHKTHWITSNKNAVIATAPGSYQSELGCPGDWQPDCLRSWLQDPDGDGIYSFTTSSIPAGNYEVKVAIDESWSENYGQGGVQNGPNIAFSVGEDCASTTFTYNATTHVLNVAASGTPPQPTSVTIPGSLQSELGCSGDWQPDCAATHLTYDADDTVWQGTFNVPAGSWEYKAALNDSWDVNYGANATRDGANIGLNLSADSAVKFYYDHTTHWITDNKNKVIAVAPGSFQSELGCPGDWQPDCLRSWLQDPDGDGIYTFTTSKLPAGNYETKVAINESWDLNYGAGGTQNGAHIAFSVPSACTPMFFSYDAATHILTVSASGAPKGNIQKAQAHWVTDDTIAWNLPAIPDTAFLHYSPTAALTLEATGVTGGTDIELTYDAAGLDAATKAKFPHLSAFKAFRIPAASLAQVPAALKGQLAVSAFDISGDLVDATSLQIPGVLDDLYTYNGPLGASFAGSVPTIRVWAPTAKSVKLLLFNDDAPATIPTEQAMTLDPASGVWSVTGEASWYGKYYLYKVEVFAPTTGEIETNLVTDPYSVNLSRNSARSHIIDLNDPATKPAGWNSLVKPRLDAPEDIVLYELHIRDFSANDPSVPAANKGTYKAFTDPGSNGMKHLGALAQAGLTHIHLLPSFDLATINEDKSQWQEPAGDLSTFPPDSQEQQARVGAVRDQDGFNWGYDPWHYNVPEGSYATSTAGAQRVLEYRQMVQGLAAAGLRVVNDVVYNHTNASGQNPKSVLDRIVPGYYHRLNADGLVERSTCCDNTASEHNMMEKLLIDSVLLWARQYKVDGFRFDIMGHHPKANLTKLRSALDALTVAADGVDGTKIYLYGEGWNFGEVANDARFVQATQANMAGTGIGTFSDRLRDGVRGGGPFSGIQEQGFLTGLSYDPNGTNQGSPADQLNRLRLLTDWIQVGLAGNLAAYQFTDRNGYLITGAQLDYNGQPAGYTADPQENISYIEAHDNETLFDAIQFKAPVSTSMAQRVRMQNLGLSILGFGQGVPFVHAGAELLRSKSLDRNSYNSGDWFNKLDFTYASNNFGVGLPMASDNQSNWPIMGPLLANPALKPVSGDILDSYDHFLEVLKIRRSSPLFRLRTGAEIQSRVQFHNTGPAALPGLIAMTVADATGAIDRQHKLIAVLLNANDEAQTFDSPLDGKTLALHPVFAASADPIVRTATFTGANGAFWIPARTAAVFWEIRPQADQIGLLAQDVNALVAAGTLKPGEGKSLLAKLNAAIDQANRGNNNAAAVQLNAFINEVRALQNSGKLPAVQAEALIAQARAILATL